MEKKKVFVLIDAEKEQPKEHEMYWVEFESGLKDAAWYMDDTNDWQSNPDDEQPVSWLKEEKLYVFDDANLRKLLFNAMAHQLEKEHSHYLGIDIDEINEYISSLNIK